MYAYVSSYFSYNSRVALYSPSHGLYYSKTSVFLSNVLCFDQKKIRGRALIRFAEHPKIPTTLHDRGARHNGAAKFPKFALICVTTLNTHIIYTCLISSLHMACWQTVAPQLYACICVHRSQKAVSALTEVCPFPWMGMACN